MRYVTKKAQAEILSYYEHCINRYDECMNNGYADLAREWWTRIETIKKIKEIVEKHGYTMN